MIVTGVPLTPGTTTVFVGAAFAVEHPARTSTAATTVLRTRLSSTESIPGTVSHALFAIVLPLRPQGVAVRLGLAYLKRHFPERVCLPAIRARRRAPAPAELL